MLVTTSIRWTDGEEVDEVRSSLVLARVRDRVLEVVDDGVGRADRVGERLLEILWRRARH